MNGIADWPDHQVAASQRKESTGIRDFVQGRGCPAAVWEVYEAAGLKVSYRLRVLQGNGLLQRGAARQYMAWERRVGYTRWERRFGYPAVPIEAGDLPGDVSLPSQVGDTVLVPVYGQIPAGPLNLPEQAFERAFLLDKQLIGEGTLFMLKVAGDSMTGAGIADGNWVVVRQQQDAQDGEIVAAMIGQEVTVKTFHRESGLLELVPQNLDYEPIPVAELTILGKVVGVVRQV